MTDTHAHATIAPLLATLYDRAGDASAVRAALDQSFASDAAIRLCHPLGDEVGPDGLDKKAFAPMRRAMPDLERRCDIAIAGEVRDGSAAGQVWVGHCGHLIGTFVEPFLDIPPTGRVAHMRYHDFFRIEGGRVVEMQAIWDIPALMKQAGAWPMAPSLGVEWMAPAPATGDGRAPREGDPQAALDLVISMLEGLERHPREGGPEVMRLDRHWHPSFQWYGPSGIGTMRGISGFRRDHQMPFLNAMPDRYGAKTAPIFFAEGNYVGTTGWPNMHMTVSGDGWLGIVPSDRSIEMRSLDFWRMQDGLLRENWVLVDLLHVWDQLGVDVLARMRELTRPDRPTGL